MVDRRRLWEGAHHYFTEIIREYHHLVSHICQSYAKDEDAMLDLVQGVWTQVYEKRRSYSGRGSFAGWLQQLTKHHCTDVYRAQRAERRGFEKLVAQGGIEEIHNYPPSPEEDLERREAEKRIWDAMDHLPAKEREAITLRLLRQMSPDEVAEEMGIEKASVRSNISRGTKRLMRIIGGEK